MQHTCLVYLFDALHMAIHVHTRMYMYRYAFMVAITRRIKAERESQIKQGNNDDEIPPRADAHISTRTHNRHMFAIPTICNI